MRRTMSREVRFKKQHKPIGFGDKPDPATVEGHLNAKAEAAETRKYNRRMKELAVEDDKRRRGLLARVMQFFTLKATRR
jgi:hypothetical protein